ncbi:riboflavin transporter MCH5 [Plectosphaerella plurivora]|uniref:Riboflavin transporter MCH5 n=1 Tax=Plectosphaerella plurivora TaxID=936078 RepID=A0A9P8V1B7_9PEZI|nr:riboflavin transporter MCH5 [Plectosphaerella plurivora]
MAATTPETDPESRGATKETQPTIDGSSTIQPVLNTEPHDADEDFPEGGLRAWLVVLGSWLASFGALGISNTMATIHAYVSEHQLADYSEGSIGWIFSIYMFLAFFGGIYIGPLFDRYGPKWLIAAGTVCVVTALMLLSICTQYWSFILVFGVFNGLGISLLFTPSYAAVGHWFKERRGLATGIASTGASFGGMVYPIILRPLFETYGWAWGIRTLAFINILFCTSAFFLVRARLPPSPSQSPHPDFKIFRDPAFSLTTLGIFLMECAVFIPLTYISSYALSKGFSQSFAYQIPTILNTGSVVGRILAGWWGDNFGAFNSNIIASFICCVSCLAIWLPAGSSMAGLVIFVLVFGFGSGNQISISPVCIGKLCETKNYGRYYATSFTVASFASLIGVPLGGELVSAAKGDYWALVLFSGVLYVASGVALYAGKAMRVGWKPWVLF